MACEHPRDRWVGTESGICCGVCGAKVDLTEAPKTVKKAEPAPEAEPVKKTPAKRGGKK